jgi:hypothetical protein
MVNLDSPDARGAASLVPHTAPSLPEEKAETINCTDFGTRGTIRLSQNGPEQDSATTRMGRVPGQQVSFIAGARSLNEESLRKTLQAFNFPQAGIVFIRSKRAGEWMISTALQASTVEEPVLTAQGANRTSSKAKEGPSAVPSRKRISRPSILLLLKYR